ncbi:TonB-dependent receptor domain-containing protein [Steroidobacter flavus]|uniref:TonB-dependent receptor domain-containing protein n=1 Tax=Steroidobacter flavus TaxID=1842136 RepID=A0ABV8SXU7_9GAMM
MMKKTMLGSVVLCAATGYAAIGAADTMAREYSLDIPPKPVAAMLQELSVQTGISVALMADDVDHRNVLVGPLKGRYTVDAALSQLLVNSELTFTRVNASMVVVTARNNHGGGGVETSAEAKAKLHQLADTQFMNAAAPTSGTAAQPLVASSAEEGRRTSGGKIMEEVLVTAQKRAERLQDVPVPVTSISTDMLSERGQLRLQDYYNKIPGLNLTLVGDVSSPSIAIRGVTTGGFVNPTVGVVVDDIPFGASTAAGNGNNGLISSDIDPSELSRVEVLRGPQGTLYGASSMGGLLKYVTADPSTERVGGNVQLGTSSVHNGEMGYVARGSINIPLSDTFAIRASGNTRRDAGYIDNIQTGQNDVNRTDSYGGRISALWRPAENFSVKLSALYQNSEREGSSDTHLPPPIGRVAGLKDLEQSALIDSGGYEQEFQAYSAIVTAKLGNAELTSLTGYSTSDLMTAVDLSPSLAAASRARFGVDGIVTHGGGETTKFSQEMRLAMPLTDTIDWLFGAFYTRERYPSQQQILAIDTTNGAVAGTWLVTDLDGAYDEYAAFTDLTFRLTERFDIQVGGRSSHYEYETGSSTSTGPFNQLFGPSATATTPEYKAKDDAFTYLLTPRYRFSDDLMMYARFASGFRPGGPNTNPTALAAGLPRDFGPDSTENYEIGMKGSVFDDLLSFDASVYYIDWKDVQLQLRDPATFSTYTLNAGKAKSQGVELSVDVRPLEGLTVSAWGVYNNAELTEVPTTSDLTARVGDRLPYSPEWSGSISVDQEFALFSDATGFVGTTFGYTGDRKGRFFRGFPQGTFPSYTQLDLRAGATFDTWIVNAYVNNVGDERGVLRSGRDATFSFQYVVTYIQPRTLGINVSKAF